MAGNVNVKVGVSGVTQFKQGMNQAKQSVKTLDAQLALSQKQFKANGDAQSYMTEKAELLKAKLEQQKAVLANAESALESMAKNGVDRTGKAYQDMYRQMLSAKGEILDTENAMRGVEEAASGASNETNEMNQQLKKIGQGVSVQNVTQGIQGITKGLENAAKKAVNLGRKIFDAMMGAGSYADDLKTRASQYGLSTEELQRMDKTANLIDTSVEAILNAQKKLRKGIGSADQGVMGAYAELLGEGYDPKKAGWENAFWDAGEALMKFADEEEKEVYAQKLFGRSWNELLPLFEAGRKEYEETNASWKVLSEEQIDSLGKMDDEYQKLKENVEQLKMSLLAEFAEPMASLLTTINEKANEFSEWLQSDDGKAVVNSVVGKVKEAIEWISKPENIQSAIDALKAILAGWALLTVGSHAMTILQFVNGIKGLFGAGAAGAAGASKAAGAGASTAGAAAGGGVAGKVLTGASNTVTGLSAKAASTLVYTGVSNMIPMVTDVIMNQTNAGRALRDGGGLGDAVEGLKQDIEEFKENIEKNAETFVDDWENNVIVRKAKEINELNQTAAEWTYGDDLSAEEAMALVQQGQERMAEAAEALTGTSDVQKQSSSEMTEAAGTMKGLPGVISNAIMNGMSQIKINIDGQLAGNILTPYVGAVMGGIITAITK